MPILYPEEVMSMLKKHGMTAIHEKVVVPTGIETEPKSKNEYKITKIESNGCTVEGEFFIDMLIKQLMLVPFIPTVAVEDNLDCYFCQSHTHHITRMNAPEYNEIPVCGRCSRVASMEDLPVNVMYRRWDKIRKMAIADRLTEDETKSDKRTITNAAVEAHKSKKKTKMLLRKKPKNTAPSEG